ncbi:unnamed protein product [Dibothriocephalus latus]|uniref:Uncharacterized protein n=1 Tax=Dibothriocephalus latus TaxID=60516 RepID=A0A3P6UYH9_DIBLA|nr:unnamed protein product [Dibothriocephalus latus]
MFGKINLETDGSSNLIDAMPTACMEDISFATPEADVTQQQGLQKEEENEGSGVLAEVNNTCLNYHEAQESFPVKESPSSPAA